jgi:hypothetical protein
MLILSKRALLIRILGAFFLDTKITFLYISSLILQAYTVTKGRLLPK